MIIKITLIILLAVILYFVFELGLFAYKYKHLPALPAIDQSERTFGEGPSLRYITAGDSLGLGATKTEKTFAYQVAERLSQNFTVAYKNISVSGYKTGEVLNYQLAEII